MTQSLIHLPQHHAVGPHGLGSRLQQPVPPLAISRCASGKGAYIFVLGYRTQLVRRWLCWSISAVVWSTLTSIEADVYCYGTKYYWPPILTWYSTLARVRVYSKDCLSQSEPRFAKGCWERSVVPCFGAVHS